MGEKVASAGKCDEPKAWKEEEVESVGLEGTGIGDDSMFSFIQPVE